MPATFVNPSNNRSYTPTNKDLLWLAVGLYGETRGHAEEDELTYMAWSWMNRMMLHKNQAWPTLDFMIRNHSQPVNPKWRRNGPKCGPGGAYANAGDCKESRLMWRDDMAAILDSGDLSAVPPHIVDFAVAFLDGQVPPPKTVDGSEVIDFGQTPSAIKYGTKYTANGDTYLTVLQAKSVPSTSIVKNFYNDHLFVEGGSPWPADYDGEEEEGSGTDTLFGLAGLAFLIWGAYQLFFKRP